MSTAIYQKSHAIVNKKGMLDCSSDTTEVSEGEEGERVASADGLGRVFEETEEGDDPGGLFLGIKKIDLQPQSN